jgi:MFS transporter, putative metabolite:H+ symporter
MQGSSNSLNTSNTLIRRHKIDELLDEIGYSYYHYFLLFILILIFFADGTEVLVISLILKSLEKEWQLTPVSKAFLASSALMGVMIGSFFTSKILDLYGRKKFLITGSSIVLIFGVLSAFSQSSWQLFIFRILMGIGIGMKIPAATVLATETIPSYNRSYYLTNMWIAFPVGELYVCIIALIFMPEFEYNQWRTVLLFCLIPIVLCIVGSFLLYESSRYYLANKRMEEAKEILRNLAKTSRNVQLTEIRLLEIVEESNGNPLNKYESDYKQLFSKRFLRLTINTWFIWFIVGVTQYITIYMLPQILAFLHPIGKSPTKGLVFKDIIISNLISLPKTLIAGFLSEISFLGRVRSICFLFSVTITAAILILIDVNHIQIYGGIIKLCAGGASAIIKVYSTEAYPTKIRGLGYGTGHSVARLAGMSAPFVSELLINYFGLIAPFYCVLLFPIVGIINTFLLPFETLGRDLDKIEREDMEATNEIGDTDKEKLLKQQV